MPGDVIRLRPTTPADLDWVLAAEGHPVGYVILAGLARPRDGVELRRIVVDGLIILSIRRGDEA